MIVSISAKCSDLFDMSGPGDLQYSGYVPDFFPEAHYGDYIILDIDTATGQIVNWKPVKDSIVLKAFAEGR